MRTNVTNATNASLPYSEGVSLNPKPANRAFENWRMNEDCEEACAAIRRADPTTALKEAFLAGRRSAGTGESRELR